MSAHRQRKRCTGLLHLGPFEQRYNLPFCWTEQRCTACGQITARITDLQIATGIWPDLTATTLDWQRMPQGGTA